MDTTTETMLSNLADLDGLNSLAVRKVREKLGNRSRTSPLDAASLDLSLLEFWSFFQDHRMTHVAIRAGSLGHVGDVWAYTGRWKPNEPLRHYGCIAVRSYKPFEFVREKRNAGVTTVYRDAAPWFSIKEVKGFLAPRSWVLSGDGDVLATIRNIGFRFTSTPLPLSWRSGKETPLWTEPRHRLVPDNVSASLDSRELELYVVATLIFWVYYHNPCP